jgi:hypothetical protein
MKRWATAVALATALLAIPVVLAATGTPKEMVLTLTDGQSVPDRSPSGNLANGFVAKLASGTVGKDKEHGRIKSYWVAFENESVPAGHQRSTASYQPPTARYVFVHSAADVFAAPSLAHDFWKVLLSSYDQLPTLFKPAGRPNVGNEARLYRSDLTVSTGSGPDSTEFGYVLVWRSRTVVATMEVSKSSDVEFDDLTKTYVMTLAKRQQARIARATR